MYYNKINGKRVFDQLAVRTNCCTFHNKLRKRKKTLLGFAKLPLDKQNKLKTSLTVVRLKMRSRACYCTCNHVLDVLLLVLASKTAFFEFSTRV